MRSPPRLFVRLGFLPVEQSLVLAPIIEQLGFDGGVLPDHVFFPHVRPGEYPYSDDGHPPYRLDAPWPDPFVLTAALASITQRISFTTAVFILSLRHPLHVAKALATVSVIAPNRLSLGVGVGWMPEEFETLGVDFAARGALTDEAIVALRKLWQPAPVEHRGRFFSFGPLHMEPTPASPIPILIGGVSRRALVRAATLGDGVAVPQMPLDDLERLLGQLRAELAAAGRDGDDFEIHAACFAGSSLDDLCRVAELGADVLQVLPWPHPGEAETSLPDRIAMAEQLAGDVLEPLRQRLGSPQT